MIYVLVESNEQQNLEAILCDFANLYRDKETVEGIQLYRKKGEVENFLIQFSNNPDFEIFSFLINYIVYPMNYPEFKPKVVGYFETQGLDVPPKLKNIERLMIYDNPSDKQPDNVYVTGNNGQSFIFDFGGRLKRIDLSIKEFEEEKVDLKDFHHIIDIYPSPSKKITEAKPWWKFW